MRGKLDIQEECENCHPIKHGSITREGKCAVCDRALDTTSMEEKCGKCQEIEPGQVIHVNEKNHCLKCGREVGANNLVTPSGMKMTERGLETSPSLPEWEEELEKQPIVLFLSVKDPVYGEENKRALASLKSFISKVEAQAEKRTLERALEALPKERDEMRDENWEADQNIGFNQCLSLSKDSLNKLLTNHEDTAHKV